MSGSLRERIESRLKALNLSARKASLLAGGSSDLIRGLLREKQVNFRGPNLSRIADVLGVSVDWLLTGEDAETGSLLSRKIQVVGYVGAGAEVIAIDDHAHGSGLEEVDCPWAQLGPSAVAVKVRGDSMTPAYFDGDLIFYDSTQTDFTHLVGKECVVALADGRRFIKQLRRTELGHWYLHSHNAEPILGVKIKWAAKVRLIQRGN
jgi:SOS-response transcriptional repressor LexA